MEHVIEAVGWTLIHFLWQGCLVACAYATACRCLAPHSPALRYGIGLLGYLGLVAAPILTLCLLLTPALDAGVPASRGTGSLAELGFVMAYPVAAEVLLREALRPAMPLVVVLWAFGVSLMSLRTALACCAARRFARQGVEAVEAPVRILVRKLCTQLGVARSVTVLRSTRVAVPSVVGWLHPVVLLPTGVLSRLPADQLALVLAHELAHVRRNDYLVNLAQRMVETLFFYHPAVAWLGRRVREDREQCCDDEVVARIGRPVRYARALVSLERLRAPAPPVLAATGGDLFRRVSRIVRDEPPRRDGGFAQFALVAALAVVVGLALQEGVRWDLAQPVSAVEDRAVNPPHWAPPRLAGALGAGLRLFERGKGTAPSFPNPHHAVEKRPALRERHDIVPAECVARSRTSYPPPSATRGIRAAGVPGPVASPVSPIFRLAGASL